MCGIIGYFGNKNAISILIKGLEKLEYRGYDSSGICLKENNNLKIIKQVGNVKLLSEKIKEIKNISNIGIGHTRWATHGKVNLENTHPHFDEKKEIAIVHNGIIENYLELKKMLQKKKIKFYSQTDSEVLVKLISYFYKNDLEKAVRKALSLINGKYAIIVISKKENNLIIAKKSSPLIVGFKKNETFISSDINSLLEIGSRNIINLNDNEIGIINKKFVLKNINGKILHKKFQKITKIPKTNQIGKFDSFTEKEIFEQSKTIKKILKDKIKNNRIKLDINFNIKKINKIFIIGCGTSYNAGLVGKYIIEKQNKIQTMVEYSSEFTNNSLTIRKNDIVIALSQSGETADTIEAIKEAKLKKAKTIGIINVKNSTIANITDQQIFLDCGPEIGVASTKAFTSQIMSLLIFSLYLKQQKEKIDKNLLKEIITIDKNINKILNKNKEIKKLAKKYLKIKNFIYIGRKINYPIALEGALKLKEISYINALGVNSCELKHGTLAIIDKKTVTIAICNKNDYKINNSISQIKSRDGNVIVLNDNINSNEFLQPILNAIFLQLFALYYAKQIGLNVDKPRNLAKSVTVE